MYLRRAATGETDGTKGVDQEFDRQAADDMVYHKGSAQQEMARLAVEVVDIERVLAAWVVLGGETQPDQPYRAP